MIIDMSLSNTSVYAGCQIEEVGGRLNLATKPAEAANIIGRNLAEIVAQVPREQRDTVTLTGAMAVWAYLTAFHVVLHQFRQVWYEDGRNEPILIAKHG